MTLLAHFLAVRLKCENLRKIPTLDFHLIPCLIRLEWAAVEMTLEKAGVGTVLRVTGLTGSLAECQRLREMGLCENARVEKLAHHHLLVCAVCGTRLAVDRKTAREVRVVPMVDSNAS